MNCQYFSHNTLLSWLLFMHQINNSDFLTQLPSPVYQHAHVLLWSIGSANRGSIKKLSAVRDAGIIIYMGWVIYKYWYGCGVLANITKVDLKIGIFRLKNADLAGVLNLILLKLQIRAYFLFVFRIKNGSCFWGFSCPLLTKYTTVPCIIWVFSSRKWWMRGD